jgi:hypothetical protein
MSFNFDREDAKRCITFSSHAVMITFQHLPVAVQGWAFHRLQDIPNSVTVLGSVPCSPTSVCVIHFELAVLDRDDLEEFIDTYEDSNPQMTEVLIITRVEIRPIASVV